MSHAWATTLGHSDKSRLVGGLLLALLLSCADAYGQAGVSVTESGGSTNVDETGPTSDTYTIVLDTQPTADVDVIAVPDAQTDVGAGAGVGVLVTFTPANWSVARQITVTAVDDADVEGAHTSTITHTASSVDGNYDGIAVNNVVANVTDNDTAGLTITQTGGSTVVNETGPTTDSYTVTLNSRPTASVTVTVDPDEETDLGSGPSVPVNFIIAPSSWSIPRTVIVTAVDDADPEGPHTSTIKHATVSADGNYNALVIPDVVASVVDNDAAGVTVTESGGSTDVNESGPTSDTYTIVLTKAPAADVVITVDPDGQTDLGGGAGAAIQFTFTGIDWNVARNVTVTAVDDILAEGPHTSTITHTAVSADPDYDGFVIGNVTANVTDDDLPGVTITETGGSTDVSEVGPTSDTYTIVLDSTPTANVTITVDPDTQTDVGAGAGGVLNLTFTPGNWSVAQTVTVTAVDDALAEGAHTSTITHSAASGDANFNGIAINNVVANVTDNDTAGVSVTESGGATNVNEAGPTSDTYTIVLDSQPTANVVITVDPDGQTDVGGGAGVAVNRTFTSGNWSTAQTVTVTAVDDAVTEGAHTSTITHVAASADPDYNGIAINNVVANVTDNDTPGVTIVESNGSTDVAETGPTSDSYTLVLDTQPANAVTMTVDPDVQTDLGSGAGVAISFVFNPGNWDTPRPVVVTAVDDGAPEGPHTSTITHSAASGDANYNGIAINNVVVNVTDNDTPGVTVIESGGSTNVTEGGATDTYTVVLNTPPANNVMVTVDPDVQTDVGSGAGVAVVLTFTVGNWNTAQTVTVVASNDDIAEGPHTSTITHSSASADAGYNGIAVNNVVANVTDNDSASVTVTQSAGSTDVSEAGPTSDTYTVVLGSEPTNNVTITVTPDVQTDVGAGAGAPIVLTFTAGNWNSAQTVTVTAVDDAIDEGPHTSTITHAAASADANYNGIAVNNVTANVTDDDTAGVTVTESGGSTDVNEAGPTSDTYTIVLTSQPTANVTITVDPDVDSNVGGGVGAAIVLTFTAGNWSTPQTVTVTAVDDAIDEGAHTSTITHVAASADGNYNGIGIGVVTANVTDNDTAGVTVTESGGVTAVSESGPTSDTYTIVLDSQPLNNVSITVTPDAQTSVGAGGGVAIVRTFTSGNWNTPQTITVTAVDDDVVEGLHGSVITHVAASADANYNGIAVVAVNATVTDDDVAGVTLVESGGATIVSEDGPTSDTYTLVLTSEPIAAVNVTVDPDNQVNLGAGAGTAIFLTFTTANWNTPQTVTVTAVFDGVPEGLHSSTVTHAVASADGNYNGLVVPNVVATVGDSPSITVTETGGSTEVSEEGPTSDTYTLVLRSQPTATVTVFVDPDPQSDLGAGAGTAVLLVFTTLNWNVEQTVTVTAVDDEVVEGLHASTITQYAVSSDGDYNGIAIPDVTVTVTDNDSAPPPPPPTGGGTGGSGGYASSLTAHSQVVKTEEDAGVEITLSASGARQANIQYFILSGPNSGVLTGNAPIVTYVPQPNFAGIDAFTYVVVDNRDTSNVATVEIEVASINDRPTGRRRDVEVQYETPLAITLHGFDADGDALVFRILDPPGFGALSGTPPHLTYHPDPQFIGIDRFRFVVSDGTASSGPVSFILRVLAPPDEENTEDVSVVDEPAEDTILVADAGDDVVVTVGQIIRFDGSGSRVQIVDAGGASLVQAVSTNDGPPADATEPDALLHFSWDFDSSDGVQEEATGTIVEWSYDVAGVYTVTLTVTDALSRRERDTLVCTVTEEMIDANPGGACGTGLCGLGVTGALPLMLFSARLLRLRLAMVIS